MVLSDYVGALRRGWWIVLGLAVFGAGAGALLAYATAPTYVAQTTVYLTISGSDSSNALQRAATYADLAETSAVLDRAADVLGGSTDVDDLREAIGAEERENSPLLDVTATSTEAEDAANRANAVAEALARQVAVLDAPAPATEVGESPQSVQLTIVQPAQVPETATTPRPRNNMLVGLAVGLGAGLLTVVALGTLDTRIRNRSDVPPHATLASVTTIPTRPRGRASQLAAEEARREAFRSLRTTLVVGAHARGSLAVVGATADSDVREEAQQLAAAFTEIGSTVVIADLDLRPSDRGSHRPLENRAQPARGVADVLTGAAKLVDVLPEGGSDGPVSLPPGRVEASSPQLLNRPAMVELLQELTARFDYVLLVCPALSERSESAAVAASAAGCLLFVESGRTRREEYVAAAEKLAGVRLATLHLVIDHVRDRDLGFSRVPEGTAAQPV